MHDGPCLEPWGASSLSCCHRMVSNSRRLSGSRQVPSSSQREVSHMSKASAFTLDASTYVQICLLEADSKTACDCMTFSATASCNNVTLLRSWSVARTAECWCRVTAKVPPLHGQIFILLLCSAGLDYLGNPNLVHAQSILATLGVQVCLLLQRALSMTLATHDFHRLFVQSIFLASCRSC